MASWFLKLPMSIAFTFYNCCFQVTVMLNFLELHGLQRARLPCLSLSPRVCSNSSLLSWWRHPTISFSVVSFSSCLQSFPESGSFPMSGFFISGGQSIGTSASSSVLPMNIQWFITILHLNISTILSLHTNLIGFNLLSLDIQGHKYGGIIKHSSS